MTLPEIQQQLKAPKNQRNSFGNYNYRSAEDIIEAVKKLINPDGWFLNLTDEVVCVGNSNYIKATATISKPKFSDEQREYVLISHSAVGWAREEQTRKGMDASQITGAASSYARKYALNGLFAIDDTKDADGMLAKEELIVNDPVAELILTCRNISTESDLKEFWEMWSEHHKDKRFISAVNNRKKQLQDNKKQA